MGGGEGFMKEVIPQSAEAFLIPTLDSSSLNTMLNNNL